MTKIFDIGNLFKHKNLRSFRRLYTQLNWGDDFNKTMRNVEDALSLVLDLDMGFEATAHEFEDGEYRDTVVIRIFEGVDDSSVGARSWTLAYLDVFADGSYHYVQNSDAKELKEFFGEWDQGLKNIFKNKIPEILKRKNPHHDKITGGLADKKSPEDFDAKALKKGTAVEMEHTNDPFIAQEIAMDHLTEDPKYYDKLEKMENPASLVKSKSDEKVWNRAISIVEKQRGYRKKDFDDFDWGLVTHLFKIGK